VGLSLCGVCLRLPRPPVRFQRGRPWGGTLSSVWRMGGPRQGSGIAKLLKGAPQSADARVQLFARICWLLRRAFVG